MTLPLDYQETIYKPRLAIGKEFEDYAAITLWTVGLPVVPMRSRKYQLEFGENRQGIEFKNDRKYEQRGALWIEVAEKADPANENYVSSGIYRHDNQWLFAIGDETRFWLFATRQLRLAHQAKKDGGWRYERVEMATSRCFLLPLDEADRWCICRFDDGGQVLP